MIFSSLKNKKVTQENSNIKFDINYDVLVLGLGTAGSLALIAAGKEGLSVAGVEQQSYMGGVGTGGAIHSYFYGLSGGLQNTIDQECRKIDKSYAPCGVIGFHPDGKKYLLEKEALDQGAELYYRSILVGVYLEDKKVIGAQIKTPEKTVNIRSQFLIDASGDAQACAMAGCEYDYGRGSDQQSQPYSSPRGILSNGKIFNANFDAGYVDPRDANDINQAILYSQTLHLAGSFTEKNKILYNAPLFGHREGRFIKGEETLSFDHFLKEEKPDQYIMQTYSNFDTHSKQLAFESDQAQSWATVCGLWSRPILAYVPLGVVIPKNYDGILVAGRCASMDHDAAQAFRMQKDMQKMGEIVALVASLSIEHKTKAISLAPSAIHKKLSDYGLLNDQEKKWKPWPETNDEIFKILHSNDPGEAIWAIYQKGEVSREQLLTWRKEDQAPLFQKNIAFALALLNDSSSTQILEKTIQERDRSHFEGIDRKWNFTQQRIHAALYLMGCLQKKGSLSFMTDFFKKIDLESQDAFHDFSQSLMALLKIGDAHQDCRESIKSNIYEVIEGDHFNLKMKLNFQGHTEADAYEDLTQQIKIIVNKKMSAWGISKNPLKITPKTRQEELLLELA